MKTPRTHQVSIGTAIELARVEQPYRDQADTMRTHGGHTLKRALNAVRAQSALREGRAAVALAHNAILSHEAFQTDQRVLRLLLGMAVNIHPSHPQAAQEIRATITTPPAEAYRLQRAKPISQLAIVTAHHAYSGYGQLLAMEKRAGGFDRYSNTYPYNAAYLESLHTLLGTSDERGEISSIFPDIPEYQEPISLVYESPLGVYEPAYYAQGMTGPAQTTLPMVSVNVAFISPLRTA